MRRQEEYFHTGGQIDGYLTAALELLGAHGLDVDTHPELLVKLVELHSAKQVMFEQVQPMGVVAGIPLPPNRRH